MALKAHCQNSAAMTEADIATWTITEAASVKTLNHNPITDFSWLPSQENSIVTEIMVLACEEGLCVY